MCELQMRKYHGIPVNVMQARRCVHAQRLTWKIPGRLPAVNPYLAAICFAWHDGLMTSTVLSSILHICVHVATSMQCFIAHKPQGLMVGS